MSAQTNTPETDAFMTQIDDSEIDLGLVAAKLGDMERRLESSREVMRLLSSGNWSAGVFSSWMEGRGARAFRNCSITNIDGHFPTKAEALLAAEKVIEKRALFNVRCWDTATPTTSFNIGQPTIEKIGEIMDTIRAL